MKLQRGTARCAPACHSLEQTPQHVAAEDGGDGEHGGDLRLLDNRGANADGWKDQTLHQQSKEVAKENIGAGLQQRRGASRPE
jgi:hypothetical protein